MAAARSLRQSLQLSIDSAPPSNSSMVAQNSSDESECSPPSSAGTGVSRDSSNSDYFLQSVLCMYDFQSDDPVHLPFKKNEILEIVQMEDTGWWAAMRRDGDVIGWIPQAFVKPLTEEMAERLWNVREELRVYEYEAEQLYNSAPISRILLYDADAETPSRRSAWCDPDVPPPVYNSLSPVRPSDPYSRRRNYPPSPLTPMPQPPAINNSVNKPTPPTPPMPIDPDEKDTYDGGLVSSEVPLSDVKRNPKILQLLGSKDALDFHIAVQSNIKSPWYLRPQHADELTVEPDGQVKSGTLIALVEKLVSESKDPLKSAKDTAFRNIFLMTFRTFMTADQLFEMLVEIFRMQYPDNLTDSQFEEWKEKCYLPTKRLVLIVFTMWLEDYRLLEEEPHIAKRMTDFLTLITTPQSQALTARLIIQSIERLTFANPAGACPTTSISPRRKRRSRPHKGDLLRLDPADIAEQLALLEHKLFTKITPQECVTYAKVQTGKSVANLNAFCATHDKLAAWVTESILNNEALGRRADTVDFWIKVAEKCRNLNNFASMSAVVNALSSTVVTRLHLTWAHVGRKSNLDHLLRYNDPSGGFSGYRTLQKQAEGPCVPFVGMYLTEIVHIQDQYSDDNGVICFAKRQRWYEVATTMLRSRNKQYPFAESESTLAFISDHLRETASKDHAKFWSRSQEVQQSELAHADIRRGLEAAGF